jgi:RNA polymerase sigma factor (sigma-70 family)
LVLFEKQILKFRMEFTTIYNKHYSELYCFLIKQNEKHNEIADLLQDVFTKLYIEFDSGAKIQNPRAWLYKVLINLIRTNYQLGKSRTLKNSEILINSPKSTDLSESFESNERSAIVIQAIAKMPDREKNILLLYHNGFSYQEMAEIMDITYSSIGTYVARAIEKLKTILKTQYNELFD